MASNAEYTEQIKTLALELGVDIETEGLNNQQLGETLKSLRETKALAEAEAVAKAEAEAVAKAEAEAVAKAEAEADKKPPYYVAEGCSVTSKKGILADGAEVKAEFFQQGQKVINDLVDRKLVIKS